MARGSGCSGLPGVVWLVLAGGLVSSVGSGATLPYLFVFLHQDRGLDTGLVGGLLTAQAVGAVAGSVIGGTGSDRLGVSRFAVLALTAAAGSTTALLLVHGALAGILVLGLYGIVTAALSTTVGALLGYVTPDGLRRRVFGISFAAGNTGAAGGALLASLVLETWPASGYALLFGMDAASFVILAVLVWRWVPRPKAPGNATVPAPRREKVGYRAVFRDRSMRWLCVVTAVMVGAGYCQLQISLPAVATARDLSAAGLGWVFAANMLAVMTLQAPLQILTRRWRRTTCLAAGVLTMAIAWLLVAVRPESGITGLAEAGIVFGMGEVLLSPVLSALVNDLAPPAMRGRYNGALALAATSGWLAGSALASLILVAGREALLFPVFVVLLVLATVAGLQLRAYIPTAVDLPLSPPAKRPELVLACSDETQEG
ncbi:MFS transporter [Streptomyces sp. NPDC060085]|uniref:MFS transporter n=1 Tax=Streptomyces sp. NPDC060085 TaxID=3347054 RepID=UPI00364C69F6